MLKAKTVIICFLFATVGLSLAIYGVLKGLPEKYPSYTRIVVDVEDEEAPNSEMAKSIAHQIRRRLRNNPPDCKVVGNEKGQIEIDVGHNRAVWDEIDEALEGFEDVRGKYQTAISENNPSEAWAYLDIADKELEDVLRLLIEHNVRMPSDILRLLDADAGLALRVVIEPPAREENASDTAGIISEQELEHALNGLRSNGPYENSQYGWYPIGDFSPLKNQKDSIIGSYEGKRYLLASTRPKEALVQKPGGDFSVVATDLYMGDYTNAFNISFSFDKKGARKVWTFTENLQGNRLALVIGNVVYSAPEVREPIVRTAVISHPTHSSIRNYPWAIFIKFLLLDEPGSIPVQLPPVSMEHTQKPLWVMRPNGWLALGGGFVGLAMCIGSMFFVLKPKQRN